MEREKILFTSESVTEGHPDKMCDQISDAILDELMKQDPMSRVACETCCTTGVVMVMGEITTKAYVDIPKIVRDTVREIGYTRGKYGFDADTCGVITTIDEQSSDIAMGVDKALEAKENKMSEDDIEAIGAGLIYPAGSGLLAGLCLFELCLISLELAGQFLLTFSSRTGSSTVLFHLSFGRSQLGTGLIHLGGPTGLRCLGIFQPGLDLLEFSALGIQGPSQNIRLGGERLNALVVCTILAVNKGQLRAKSL